MLFTGAWPRNPRCIRVRQPGGASHHYYGWGFSSGCCWRARGAGAIRQTSQPNSREPLREVWKRMAGMMMTSPLPGSAKRSGSNRMIPWPITTAPTPTATKATMTRPLPITMKPSVSNRIMSRRTMTGPMLTATKATGAGPLPTRARPSGSIRISWRPTTPGESSTTAKATITRPPPILTRLFVSNWILWRPTTTSHGC